MYYGIEKKLRTNIDTKLKSIRECFQSQNRGFFYFVHFQSYIFVEKSKELLDYEFFEP